MVTTLSSERMDRIEHRLPRFYRTWDSRATVFRLLESFGRALDEHEKRLYLVMKSHWVDTASGASLDRLGSIFDLRRRPQEDDERYRRRIKTSVDKFEGGGTREAIISQVKFYFNLNDDEISLIENPPEPKEIRIEATNDSPPWPLRSMGVAHEDVEITLTLRDDIGNRQGVRNPTITNSTMNLSVSYDGMLNPGETLVIRKESAELNGTDVKPKINWPTQPLKLPRRTSEWKYTEATSPLIGYFSDENHTNALFSDENHTYHVFHTKVPVAQITFKWAARIAAKIQVIVSGAGLDRMNANEAEVLDLVNTIKAAGVIAEVRVTR